MKTDELIGILATGARPVAPHRLEQRFGGAALLGLLGAGVLMLLGYGAVSYTHLTLPTKRIV